MSLQILEQDALKTIGQYLDSAYTIDVGGLIGLVASQFTPSDPRILALIAASSPRLLPWSRMCDSFRPKG